MVCRAVVCNEFPSVLTALHIDHPVVANCLIDMRGIETVLLIKVSLSPGTPSASRTVVVDVWNIAILPVTKNLVEMTSMEVLIGSKD